MAQVVEPHRWEFRFLQDASEGPIQQVLGFNGTAEPVAKDEAISASDQAHGESFCELPLLVTAERSDSRWCQSDVAAALGALGLALHEASAPYTSDRATYLKHAALQVDILPLQAEQLPLAHPGGERKDVEGLKAISSSSQEKAPRFIGVQGAHLRRSYARRIDCIANVEADQAPAQCLTERPMEHAMDMPYRSWRESLGKL